MFKVAIIGKPNVGKSTLFNRLLGRKQAIVLDQPGITRDRNYGVCDWLNRNFELIDTGGFTVNKLDSDNEFQHLINLQVNFAIAESNLLLYVLSEKELVDTNDFLIAKQLKKSKKPIVLVINKAEKSINAKIYENQEYLKLGLGDPIYVSAEHGLNIYSVFDAIFQYLPKQDLFLEKNLTFCVIGRPNVGKSSLVNNILQENKMMVSATAGTTRDAIDNDFQYEDKKYTIIDTAGLRKRGKLDEIEKFALLRSKMAIKRSQLVLLMIDASSEITDQDKNVAQLVYDANMPCIIIANKIDLISNPSLGHFKEIETKIKAAFQFLPYAPILFTSNVTNKTYLAEIIRLMLQINDQLQRKIEQRYLDDLLLKIQVINPPSMFKGGKVDLKSIHQVEARMPTFVIKVNNVKYLHFSYMRYLENQIRKVFNLTMIPILVYYKDAKSNERNSNRNE